MARRSSTQVFAMMSGTAILAAVGVGVAGPASADADRDARQRVEHQAITAFWTADRMRGAIPMGKQLSPGWVPDELKAGRAAGPIKATTGASWNAGGAILARTGKVYFTMANPTTGARVGYVCSGSVVDDGGAASYSVVLTAGHCAYDQARKEFAQNFMFVPAFDTKPNLSTTNCAAANTAYGCWSASALVVDDKFATAGSFNAVATQNDWAFAVVGPGGRTGQAKDLQATLGGYQLTTAPASGNLMAAFGYPAASPYNGKDLVYCAGSISPDTRNSSATWGMPCAMTGGSSGGPWLLGLLNDGSAGQIGSLNSYGYTGKKAMYGPKFNANTLATLNAAKAQAAAASAAVPVPPANQIVTVP